MQIFIRNTTKMDIARASGCHSFVYSSFCSVGFRIFSFARISLRYFSLLFHSNSRCSWLWRCSPCKTTNSTKILKVNMKTRLRIFKMSSAFFKFTLEVDILATFQILCSGSDAIWSAVRHATRHSFCPVSIDTRASLFSYLSRVPVDGKLEKTQENRRKLTWNRMRKWTKSKRRVSWTQTTGDRERRTTNEGGGLYPPPATGNAHFPRPVCIYAFPIPTTIRWAPPWFRNHFPFLSIPPCL